MADQLASAADLAAALQLNVSDIPASTATLLLECATAVVQQAAGGQRILQVTGDTFALIGTSDSWLDLPQIPVTAASAVTLDGTALTAGTLDPGSYALRGNRLWRTNGWQTYWGQPSDVAGTYTHGYASTDQGIQLARSAVISLAKSQFTNPSAVASESIDDYNVSYQAMSAQMEAAEFLKAALKRAYGRRASLTRIG